MIKCKIIEINIDWYEAWKSFVSDFVPIFNLFMKPAYILVFFLWCNGLCKAQDTVKSVFTKYYTVNQLKSDFVFFRTTLEIIHPSLYRYHPKDTIDAYFNKTSVQLDHSMNELEYWRILAQVIAKLGSGHTSVVLSDAAYRQYGSVQHDLIPANLYIQNDRLYIRSRLRSTDTLLTCGSEVLAINNVSGPAILNKMREFVSGDGYSNTFKDRRISSQFNYLYNLINGDQYQFFLVLNDKGKIKRGVVKAVNTLRPIPSAARPVASSTTSYLPTIKYPEDMPGTAVITIPNFRYEKEYEALHARFFKEVRQRNITNLVIDLRNNPGGKLKISNDVMSYIMTHRYYYGVADERYVNISRIEYLSKKSVSEGISLADIQNLGRSLYRHNYDDDSRQEVRMHEFKGKLYVLINEGSFSAAALFATTVKNQRDCIILGEETGGNAYGSDADVNPIILPETHLKLNLPIDWIYAPTYQSKNTGGGLKPDIQVSVPLSSSYNFKEGDPVLDAVKENIKASATKAD